MFNHNGREKKMAVALAAVNGLGLLMPLTAPLAATFEDNGAAEAAKIIKGGGQLVDRLYFKTAAAAYTPTVSSGTVSGETVTGEQTVTGSGKVSNTLVSGVYAYQYVESGGSAIGTNITSNGNQYVRSGGSTTGTIINRNSLQSVYDGGSVIGTIINSDGQQDVSDNGIATSTTINNGGQQQVYDNGIATSTTINSGGQQHVYDNGIAIDTIINNGGEQWVFYREGIAAGTATGTTINNGGQQLVYDGGISSGTKIYDGGVQKVYTSDTYLSGGTDHGATIFSGGKQEVYDNGSAIDATINSGGVQLVYNNGSATGTTINSGGEQIVAAGGSATSATINNGGEQNVQDNGSTTGTTINSGGTQYLHGSATDTIISGGSQYIRSHGSAAGTTISGGEQIVDEGGSATDTTIKDGGVQIVSCGTASNTIVSSGGTQEIDDGCTASGTTVKSGGKQTVSSGGTAVSATVENGGLQAIDSGGTASGTTVKSGGKQTVSSGGIISATVVNEGGIQELAEGAIVSGGMTLSGTLEISTVSMNIADTLTAISGSTVQFKNGGSAKTLTIAKLQGSTNFVINTDIVSGTSDKINITDATGSTNTVQIGYDPCFENGAGTTNASGGGVTFATVTSGGTASTFKAKETEYSAYKFTPTITNTSTNSVTEYKVASIFGEDQVTAGSLLYTAGDAAGMALTAIRAENNNLTKRMGELRRSDKASGVWVRSYGGEQTVDTSIRRAEQNYHGLQGGYDKVKELANGKLFAGYTVGYLKATGDLERGDSDNSSLSLGLYGSWLGDKGHYFDIIAKRSRQNNSYRTYLNNGLNTRLDADYRTHGTTLGMEYGYRKELKDGYYLEPQAELIYSRIGGVDYKVSDGTEASQASIRSLIGRIGATYGKRTDHQNYYIKLSAAREFTAKERVRMHLGSMSAVGMEESLKESWLEIALGLTGEAGRNSDYYVELTKTTGDKVKEDWQASVGMRWKF